jgi:hypothetical protein
LKHVALDFHATRCILSFFSSKYIYLPHGKTILPLYSFLHLHGSIACFLKEVSFRFAAAVSGVRSSGAMDDSLAASVPSTATIDDPLVDASGLATPGYGLPVRVPFSAAMDDPPLDNASGLAVGLTSCAALDSNKQMSRI